MKLSAFVAATAFSACVSVSHARIAQGDGKERQLDEFGPPADSVSMSVPHAEMVALDSFGELIDGELAEGDIVQNVVAPSKQPSTIGKSGKGNGISSTKINARFYSFNVGPVPGATGSKSRVLFDNGVLNLEAVCTNGPNSYYLRLEGSAQRKEDLECYGQDADFAVSSKNVTVSGDPKIGFPWLPRDDNNDPGAGAFTCIGKTSQKQYYVGVDGGSFIGTITAAECKFSGVINTNF